MKKTFTIVHDAARDEAIKAINELDFAKPHCVSIGPKRKDRSLAQNSLYWKWLGVIADDTGHTSEELHQTYKREYLVPIFRRDRPGYKAMIKTVGKLKGERGFGAMVKEIIRLTSTTDCSVKQFTEYLNEIEKAAGENGYTLPHPEDYREAMGSTT